MDLCHKIIATRYRIEDKIGEGGMATVYKAFDLRLSRYVAVKFLKDEYKSKKDFVERFKIEAKAAASLDHINIVTIFDVGEDIGEYFIVMEYLDGVTLKEYIDEKGVLENDEVLTITGAIASAIHKAHQNHIIHRDIKPQNVMITKNKKIKVMDFGIAKMSRDTTINADSYISGSVHYIAPEQVKRNYSDERTDIYSLGITMFEMLTGKVPFEADNDVSVAIKHINDNIPSIRDINDKVPASIEQIILKATHKNPEMRYQNAQLLLKDLKKVDSTPDDLFIRIENKESFDKTKTTMLSNKDARVARREARIQKAKNKQKEARITLIAALTGALLAIILSTTIILLNKDRIFPKRIIMPNLSEMTVEARENFLAQNQITYEISEEKFDDKIPKGQVIVQSVKEGEIITKGDILQLVVSKGKELYEVPNVKNLDYETAITLVEINNLNYELERIHDDEVAAGVVISQVPAKGTMLAKGSIVTINVSLGPEEKYTTMPDLRNLTLDEGLKLIEESKLEIGEVSESYNDEVEEGRIIASTVLPDETIKEGYVVDITVSIGKEAKNFKSTIYIETILGTEEVAAKLKVMVIVKGEAKEVYNADVTQSDFVTPLAIEVEGKGTGKYEVYKDGEFLYSKDIVFSTEG